MIPLRSSLFLTSLVLFIIHQVVQKGMGINWLWFDNYLDNRLAMPVILSVWQAERILLFKKPENYQLRGVEIIVATVYISLVTEIVFPLFSNDFRADWFDMFFYAAGSLLFFFKNGRERKGFSSTMKSAKENN